MEGGVPDVTAWYANLEGHSPINFGAASGHGGHRPAAADRPLDDGSLTAMTAALRRELAAGALGIGMILEETPGATPWEVLEVFRAAAAFKGARVHAHVRGTKAPQYWLETEEVLAAALVSGAPLQIVHINSSYGEDAGKLLDLVRASRARGLDVTVEAYPYTAAMTSIESPTFDDWPSWAPSRFARFEWPATGERLTRESFARRRQEKGLVIIHGDDEAAVRSILSDSLVMVASDGLADASGAHPRGAGTFAKVLGRYVREESLLTLMEALRKATLLPAQALEARAPAMRRKGRVQPGMDADLAVFDAASIADRATYREPRLPSAGFRHVIVNGMPVIRSGQPVAGALPGTAIRAPREQ
jgi:N-acyl-D-aspartate/D-glutamate deacylase